MVKYNITSLFFDFALRRELRPKLSWRNFVVSTINSSQETQWKQKLDMRPDLTYFRNLHSSLTVHQLWIMGKKLNKTWLLAQFIYMSLPVDDDNAKSCTKCHENIRKPLEHFMMYCTTLDNTRDVFFENIVANICQH